MPKFTDKDHRLLSFLEQEYLLHGAIPTAQLCVDRNITTKAHYDTCLGNIAFRHALIARGITLKGFNLEGEPDLAVGLLSEHQLVVANAMLDLRDNRSQVKKLRELNVSTAKWEAWLRDPTFNAYLRQRAENLLGDNLHESHLALLDRVRSGDVNAIKYFNEITGRYVPAANTTVDVNGILMRVIEIIQRRVTDPELMSVIADDMLALSAVAAPSVPTPSYGSPRALRVIEASEFGGSEL